MPSILIEPHYLPCIEYFAVISSGENVLIEVQENYIKQSYRNRCRIMTVQGPQNLYIPVVKPSGKVKLKDIRIDHKQKWVKDHWGTLKTAYGNAPFFEHFGFLIEEVYSLKLKFLVDLNLEFIRVCNKLLGLKLNLNRTTDYVVNPGPNIVDWRSRIHPKIVSKNSPIYKPCNYNQIFGKKFVGNLSILDLLFCEGSSAREVLENSKS